MLKVLGGGIFDINYDTSGLIITVTDQYENNLVITRNKGVLGCGTQYAVTSVAAINNNHVTKTYTYQYSATGNLSLCKLIKITKPDNKFTQYTYDTAGNILNVINELGVVNQTSNVDSNGSTILNAVGSSANINKVEFTYNPSQTVMRDGRNNYFRMNWALVNGVTRATGFDKYCSFCSGIQGSLITYNANGYLDQVTDYLGYITKYNFDSNNLLVSLTQAYGTSLNRTTNYTYNTLTRDLLNVTEPTNGVANSVKSTTMGYDANGALITLDIMYPLNDAAQTSVTRSTDMYYNTFGELIKITGPKYVNTTFNDAVSVTYSFGRVATVTNGLNQTVTYSNYNDFGVPGTITGLNLDIYNIAFDTLGRMTSSTYQSGITTAYAYNDAGQITQITYPNLNYIKPYFDAANRLTKIEEYDESSAYLGQAIYSFDSVSNVVGVSIINPSNTTIRSSTTQYDIYNNLYKAIGSISQTTQYTYDANMNVTQTKDPLGYNVNKTYDALNRFKTITNPDTGLTAINYNIDDTVAFVIDPKNLSTSYTYNGMGELIKTVSPDTGSTIFTRDISGNVITKTDNKGIVSNYTYDVLNRLTTINYTNNTQDTVNLAYDNCTNGVGKLCQLNDATGATIYSYNSLGLVATKVFSNVNSINPSWVNNNANNLTLVNSYNYSTTGRLISQVYPSGLTINYSYTNNKIINITYTYNGTTLPLINSLNYEAFNSEFTNLVFGNSNNLNQTFSQDGLINSISSSSITPINKNYIYDISYNLTNIIQVPTNALLNSSVIYDSMNRIVNYTYGTTLNNYAYTYNSSFDRLSRTANTITTNYVYNVTNHKLTSTNGGIIDAIAYDLNGNISSFSGGSLTYNVANRLVNSSFSGFSTNYLINAMNQRTNKINANENKYFNYSGSDLIGEYDGNLVVTNNPAMLSEYIYLNSRPIGIFRNGVMYFIYTDQIKSPRVVADINNTIVWTWDNKEAFGSNLPNETISGTTFKFNLRFMGQYFDNESGLSYNLNRDYNPNWGRYIESDPIGLAGGINTYGYVGGNSLGSVDPSGLVPTWQTVAILGGIGAISGGVNSMFQNSDFKSGIIKGGLGGMAAGVVIGVSPHLPAILGTGIISGATVSALAGIADNVTQQGYNIMIGKQTCGNIDWVSAGFVGAIFGIGGSVILRPFTSKLQKVTSWTREGQTPNLNSERWVMTGINNLRNWGFSGASGMGASSNNSITGTIPGSKLIWPTGWESFKGYLGQRGIK